MRPGRGRDQRARARACRPSPTRPCAPDRRAAPALGRRRPSSTTLLPEAFAVCREAGAPAARHAPLRRPADRRHGAARGQRSPRWRPARARRWWRRCPPTSTRSRAGASHIVTVNDYLARRDAQWMGPIYHALGLTRRGHPARGVVPLRSGLRPADIRMAGLGRSAAGGLRGRHHLRHEQRVRLRLPPRQHALRARGAWSSASYHYAIVDEVDSILIDEARTPLIISGPTEEASRALLREGQPDHPAAQAGRHHRGGQALRDRGDRGRATSSSTRRRRPCR